MLNRLKLQLLLCGLDISDSLKLKFYSMPYVTHAYSANYYCFLFYLYNLNIIVISQLLGFGLFGCGFLISIIHPTNPSSKKCFLSSRTYKCYCLRIKRNTLFFRWYNLDAILFPNISPDCQFRGLHKASCKTAFTIPFF